MPRSRFAKLLIAPGVFIAFAMLTVAAPEASARLLAKSSHFTLTNGMEVVVIEDKRVPVVTHEVWYKAGASDETDKEVGIAHFLEHLMFKGTHKMGPGGFDKIITGNGGVNNAYTNFDTTYYYERLPAAKLKLLMELGAGRMSDLVIPEAEVEPERGAVIAEHGYRVDNEPSGFFQEKMRAILYPKHPYGRSILGTIPQIKAMKRADALAFYRRFYGPNNAILIVAGDVDPENVRALAEATYGQLPRRDIKARTVPPLPAKPLGKHFTVEHPQVISTRVIRNYRVPSYETAKPGEAEAVQLMQSILGGGNTSRLYQKLVIDERKANTATASYDSDRLGGILEFSAEVADGAKPEEVEALMDRVVSELIETGAGQIEMEEQRALFVSSDVYDADNQLTLARTYGSTLAEGGTMSDVEDWSDRIGKVTADDINAVAKRYLSRNNSVTGYLTPKGQAAGVNQ